MIETRLVVRERVIVRKHTVTDDRLVEAISAGNGWKWTPIRRLPVGSCMKTAVLGDL